MARANRLGDKKVQAANTPGMYADGNNLYLQVDRKTDSRATIQIVGLPLRGSRQRRHMGLGAFPK